MYLNQMSKKRGCNLISNPFVEMPKITKKKSKSIKFNIGKISTSNTNKNKETDGESEEHENPLVIPNIFGSGEEDNLIYLKNNHLFFHTEVSEESVDKVKKLMREYWNKFSHISKEHNCIKYTPKPLYLHIFSAGGCVYSGFSLYDFICEYKKKIPVYTIVEGMVASAATFFSVAGTKRYMTQTSYMLIHQLSTIIGGNFEQVQDGYDNSKKSMDKIMHIYKTHTKINKKKIPNLLKHDLNLDADECLRYGMIDEIKLVDIFNDSDDFNDFDNSNEESL